MRTGHSDTSNGTPISGRSRSNSVTSTSSGLSAHSALSSVSGTSSLALSEIGSIGDEFASNMIDLLSHETRDVVKNTWAMAIRKQNDKDVTPVATFVASFFTRLYELSPETKLLFGHDMSLQGKSLTNVLTGMLEFLVHPKKLKKQLKHLAKLHVSLGITPEMFEAFGKALIDTIALRLGENWSPQTERAWVDAYGGVSGLIIHAMEATEIEPSDIPLWMVERYKDHHKVLHQSWEKATAGDEGEKILHQFFDHLKAIAPQAFHIYERADARKRKVIVWSAVTKILDALEKPRSLRKEMKLIAVSHAKMGIDEAMLEGFGEALRASLKDCLGAEYTTDMDVIWKRCYRLLSLTMAVAIHAQSGKAVRLTSKKGAKDCVVQ